MSHGEGEGGGERWLISYADFITLLMVLFVVLYSMGQTDVQRYKQLADSLRAAFSGGPVKVVDPMIDQAGGTEKEAPSPIIIPGIPNTPLDSVEVAGQLTDMLAKSSLGGSVSVQNNIEGVLISLSEKLLFAPGTAELQGDAYQVLDAVVEMVQPLDNDLRVIGYTDDTEPSRDFANNWQLSVARALTIVDYLVAGGVAPERVTASGRAEFHPIFPNDTPEHRLLNGRADIIVVYPVDTEIIDADWTVDENPGSADPDTTDPGD
jgi:chemotaxis protein MotB